MYWKAASWAAFLALVGIVMVFAMTHSLLASQPILLGIQVLAFLLMIWARVHLGLRSFHAGANPTQGGLITTGPYRFVRHPIYASIFYFLAVSLISHPSWLNAALFSLALGAIAIRVLAEERLLIHMYPEYREYSMRVKRIVPYVV